MRQNQHKWPLVALGTIATERSIRAGNTDHLPILSVTKHRGFVPSLDYFKKQVFSRNTSNYKLVTLGQFAYATIHLDEGSIDYLRNFDAGLISPMYTVFEVDQSQVDPAYLLRVLKSPQMIKRFGALGQGSVNRRKSIGFNQLAKLEVALPSLSEQRRVAEILADIDEDIQSSRGVAEQLQVLKRGAMQQLFSCGMPHRHNELKKQERPSNWTNHTLSDLGQIQSGRQRSPHHSRGMSYPYLRVANVFDGYIDTSDVYEMLFTERELAQYRLAQGDILLNEGQSLELVGRPAMYMGDPEDCCFQNTLIRFRPSEKIDGKYALSLFQHFLYSGRFAAIAKRTTSIAHLGVARFAALQIALPPLDEQREIVDVLASFDARLRLEHERIAQLEIVKRGLAQGLLSGGLSPVPKEVPA